MQTKKLNGCHNHAPFLDSMKLHNGLDADKNPVVVEIPFTMTRHCVYSTSNLGQIDKGCDGCSWREIATD